MAGRKRRLYSALQPVCRLSRINQLHGYRNDFMARHKVGNSINDDFPGPCLFTVETCSAQCDTLGVLFVLQSADCVQILTAFVSAFN
jgi:hypothetical protein